MCLTRDLILVLLFILLIGCSKSDNSGSTASPINKTNIECDNNDEVRFEWNWCNQNLETGNITHVCYGTVYYQDMIFSSIKLEKTSSSNQCLFSNGSWEDINLVDCSRGIKREYMPIYGEQIKFQIDECYDNSQKVVSVKGEQDSKEIFKASRP